MTGDGTNLPTVCVLCSHNCGLRVDVQDGRIVGVRGDDTNPITKGYVCNKAFGIAHYVEHGDRVRYPMRRQPDGTFERIDWTTAISEIAARLNEIRARHSPRAIALVGIGGQGNHMDAPYAMAFLRGTGSRRWFNAFAQEKTQHNLIDQWMFDASPATFLHADTERARFVLVLGTNPKISNRGHNATETFKALADDSSRTVVVADPRETDTTRTATRHLQVQPGTDVYLLLAMAAVIVREGLDDRRFVDERTIGFEVLRAELAAVDVATMAARCGLEVDTIVDTARGGRRLPRRAPRGKPVQGRSRAQRRWAGDLRACSSSVFAIRSTLRERTSAKCSGTTCATAWPCAFCSSSRVIQAHSGRERNASTPGSLAASGRLREISLRFLV